MRKEERKETANKGFSLVELIIVVAIMAVLVGILAPQYLRYVERTRLQRDNSAIAEIVNAIKISAADEDINAEIAAATGGLTLTVTHTAGDAQVIDLDTITNGNDLAAELAVTVGAEYETTSTTYATATGALTFTITANATNGTVEVAVGNWIDEVGGTPRTNNDL